MIVKNCYKMRFFLTLFKSTKIKFLSRFRIKHFFISMIYYSIANTTVKKSRNIS